MSRASLLLSVGASLLFLTACGNSPPNPPTPQEPNPPEETPSESSSLVSQGKNNSNNEPEQPGENRVKVYFPKMPESQENFTYVEPVWRRTDSVGVAQFALEQLIAGPRDSEQEKGLVGPLDLRGDSNCGSDFQIAINNDLAKLQFCRTVVSAGVGDDARIASAVEATLKQFSTVEEVVILTPEGNCFGDMSGRNLCLDKLKERRRLSDDSKLRLTGIGQIDIGMSIAEATQVTGHQFTQRSSGGEEYGCLYYEVTEGPDGIAFMVTDGKIARVEVTNSKITTLSGIKVGDTEDKIRSVYGDKIKAEPHEYEPDGKYLIYVPDASSNQDYRVIFETNAQGEVTMMRSGKLPEVGYVEGCV
ncbi:MAG: GerMN domain-containing protein [Kamptonema sp. SIO4C4]|nr:GerMN domain-containing protein [Kamptonema sp. SIO4C4]